MSNNKLYNNERGKGIVGNTGKIVTWSRLEHTIFINGCLVVLKNLRCLQLKKELDSKKDLVKISHHF